MVEIEIDGIGVLVNTVDRYGDGVSDVLDAPPGRPG